MKMIHCARTSPLFCLSIAKIRSNSEKSDGRIGLDIEVISIPRLFAAALIRESAGLPFIWQYVDSSTLREIILKISQKPHKLFKLAYIYNTLPIPFRKKGDQNELTTNPKEHKVYVTQIRKKNLKSRNS